jgi:predicted kinase
MPAVIIITGLPCTGKTTLGQWLANQLRFPFIHKDGIKEILFEQLGWSDREWSRQLGLASSELLYYFVDAQLAAGCSLVVESNFDPTFATPRFRALQARYPFLLIQVHCKADGEVLFRRFQARSESSERHPGHVDQQNYAEFERVLLAGISESLPLDGPVLEIDTTEFQAIDYPKLLASLQLLVNSTAV